MSPFVHPSLLWFLPLLGLPLLIHLINLVRQRRVRFAAMEFLLASQKKNRNWIVLKQLLLLLLRTLAVAAVVLMAAQPLLRDALSRLLSRARTHHLVLLDDTLSMTENLQGKTVFANALQAVNVIAASAQQQSTTQEFTMLRFSRSQRGQHAAEPDLAQVVVDSDFPATLAHTLEGIAPTELSVSPLEALAALKGMASANDHEQRIIYLVSDFRARDWSHNDDLKKALEHLQSQGAALRLVQCAEAAADNLTLENFAVGPGIHAAGVPMLLDVTVHNHGSAVAKDVTVLLSEDGVPRPSLTLEKIPPGESATRRVSTFFPTAGEHELLAQIANDTTLLGDNSRHLLVDLPDQVQVLLIDGSPQALDAQFVAAALAPGGKVHTGMHPIIETPKFLRDHPLYEFSAILICNLDILEGPEVAALEAFAKQGGGVGFFVGEKTQSQSWNVGLYRDGAGIAPLPLDSPTQLFVDRSDPTPDLIVSDHPVMRVLAGQRNSFIRTVNVDWYFGVPRSWLATAAEGIQVIARLRNQAPLLVEKSFGNGRSMVFLSKAAPTSTPQGVWNNWGKENPSYVVAMMELVSYLCPHAAAEPPLVGTPLVVQFPAKDFQSDVRLIPPTDKSTLTVSAVAEREDEEYRATFAETTYSGIYKIQKKNSQQLPIVSKLALNVDPHEGDLRRIEPEQLAEQLTGLQYTYTRSGDMQVSRAEAGGTNLASALALGLLGLLLCEQFLAYSASYHVPPEGKR
jgi:hypothetical protein